ncbi:RNA-dependent RNA polymerase [Pleurostoma richardsiae]|uniref:RNA-dependent RNA polymerase n=1 Tax=Pleurostoma richardsiae TaxID=41990 RepID=A0AA38RRZ3_9PEZI|nr:RNA-dependent RNA polymerase [Pleurostoma richardsiae]
MATPSPSTPSHSGPRSRPTSHRGEIDAAVTWQSFRSIKITLFNLPLDITTLEIWNAMRQHANVVHIDLLENRQGEPIGRANVRIEPPPRRNPWRRWECTITRTQGTIVKASVRFDRGTPIDGTMRSPLNNIILERAILHPMALRFGMMVKQSTMMEMRRLQTRTRHPDINVTVDFSVRLFKIRFIVRFEDSVPLAAQQYEAIIRFSHIKKIHRVELSPGNWGILIVLPSPPSFYRKSDEIAATHSADRPTWGESDVWLRQINIMREPWLMKNRPATLDKADQFIDIGKWTTYCLELGVEELAGWHRFEGAFRDFNIKLELMPNFSTVPPGDATYFTIMSSVTDYKTSHDALALLDSVHLPFSVRYQLEVCISHGVFNEHNIDMRFLEKLQSYSNGSDKAKWMLESAAEDNVPIYDPMTLFENQRALSYYPSTTKLPSYCTVVRKAMLTPTTMYLNSPTVEATNRVLREYRHVNDHFLRVSFTDELTQGRVSPNSDSRRDDEIYTQVFRALNNGIIIGDRHYRFLAFGNSQMRENGAYFFCSTGHVTCDSIRRWMGDLKDIRCVAKYAARMGQCFSTTRQILGINVPQIKEIPDTIRHGHCFTDGVGKISVFLADMVAHDLKRGRDTPSAFQFRMGGCKGVLAVSSDTKPHEVHIRSSQAKFSAVYNGLEIIRCSTFATASLNRQTITILSTLGVDDSVFEDLISEQLFNYDRAMWDKKTAMGLLGRYIDEYQMTLIIAQMVHHGFMDTREPFVWTLLRLWRSWSVKYMKEKARIIVEKSAFVLGCVDETNTLRGHSDTMYKAAGLDESLLPQIFLQIPDGENSTEYKVVTGLCLVGRNPSLHPGDIRVVEAVDAPSLRHMKNVVVFPQTGDRDIPSMCSGGDLDGDDYFVIWDQNLIPPEWNYPPMDYTADKPVTVNREVEIHDVIQFFVLYMKNDTLPRIALAHLAQSDWLQECAKHPKCLELAALHSKAVDYVKSGNPAVMPKKLRPRKWPHFMEKRPNISYHSTNILGKLYDKVKRIEFHPAYEMPFDKRILERYKLDVDILKKARKLKTKYDTAMRRVMAQTEVTTEFEIYTTFVLSNPRLGTSYKLQETIGREASALKQRFVAEAIKEVDAKHRGDREKLWPFIAAMYQVTNEEIRIALHEARSEQISSDGRHWIRRVSPAAMPLLSFPWIFHSELGQMASGLAASFSIPALTKDDNKPPQEQAGQPQQGAEDEEEAPKRKSLGTEELLEMDYVRTGDGKVIHRGEVLNLFTGPDVDVEEIHMAQHSDDEPQMLDQQTNGSPTPATACVPSVNGADTSGTTALVTASRPIMPASAIKPPVQLQHTEASSTITAQATSSTAPMAPPGLEPPTNGQMKGDEHGVEEVAFEEESVDIDEESGDADEQTAVERMKKLGF